MSCSVGFFIALHELEVSYNKVTELPDSIEYLKKLLKLRVEVNRLVSPPPEVVEQGIHAVKQYLCEKINGMHDKSPKIPFDLFLFLEVSVGIVTLACCY